MQRPWLSLLFVGSLCSGCTVQQPMSDQRIIIHIVRHGEKADPNDGDTPLSDAGHARARDLATTLAGASINAVYTTEKKRTQQTAQPTADRFGLELTIVPNTEQARLMELLRSAPAGSRILVVGHSNTVPVIVGELAGTTVGAIDENEFNNLYVVTLQEGKSPVLERRTYGAAPQ